MSKILLTEPFTQYIPGYSRPPSIVFILIPYESDFSLLAKEEVKRGGQIKHHFFHGDHYKNIILAHINYLYLWIIILEIVYNEILFYSVYYNHTNNGHNRSRLYP